MNQDLEPPDGTPPTGQPSEQPDAAGGSKKNDLSLSCDEARRQITYLIEEGYLKEAERMVLFGHVNKCISCKNELERKRQLDARLKSSFKGLDTNPYFTQDVLDALPAEKATAQGGWWRRFKEKRASARQRRLLDDFDYDDGSSKGRLLLKWLHSYRLPLAAFALVILASLGVARWRHGIVAPPSLSAPMISAVSGKGILIHNGESKALAPNMILRRGDVIQASTGAGRLSISFSSNNRLLARVFLKSGTELSAENRHHYMVRKGVAYFEVSKTRPRAKDEFFDVHTPLGFVQVLGTVFQVDVPSEAPTQVTIVVKEGRVQIRPYSGEGGQLTAAEEVQLISTGGIDAIKSSLLYKRLAWLQEKPSTLTSSIMVGNALAPRATTVHPGIRVINKNLDWDHPVVMDFRGRTFSESLKQLAEELGDSPELFTLAAQVGKASEKEGTLHLLIRRPLPLLTIVRWLARESGWQVERGDRVQLHFISKGERRKLWPPEAGLSPTQEPSEIVGRMPPLAFSTLWGTAPESENLEDYLFNLAAYADENLFLDAQLKEVSFKEKKHGHQGTFQDRMLEALKATDLNCIWYDGLWYVASKDKIEERTLVERSVFIGKWIRNASTGKRSAEWAKTITHLVAALRVSEHVNGANGAGLTSLTMLGKGPSVADSVELSSTEDRLSFKGGVTALKHVEKALWLLASGSTVQGEPVAELNEYKYSGSIRSVEDLIKAAAGRNVRVLVNGTVLPFQRHVFRNRKMPLGRALEWAVRLNGLGLRAEQGHWVVDSWAACYGVPELRVLNLERIVELFSAGGSRWPRWVGERLLRFYPELFKDVSFYPLQKSLAFTGDRRQLAKAQRFLMVLEERLRTTRAGEEASLAFDFEGWQPEGRVRLIKNLNMPYVSSERGVIPGGKLVSLLRSQFTQLGASIIMDAKALAKAEAKTLEAVPVKGLNVGAALSALVEQAGLKVVLEGDVILLK